MYNKSPAFLDFYDDYKYTNGNLWVGGSSGAGKTFTLQCIGGRLRQQGRQVIYIVPKKGHEFRPLCEQIGGQFIRLSPSSKDCINIMDIRRVSLDAYSGLKDLSAREDSVLADKISRLIIWYSLLKKELSDEDKNYLDASLVECERVIFLLGDAGAPPALPAMPNKRFFAAVQADGSHRFFEAAT